MERTFVKGEEMENKKDVEYIIIKVDGENLKMMPDGKTEQYHRK